MRQWVKIFGAAAVALVATACAVESGPDDRGDDTAAGSSSTRPQSGGAAGCGSLPEGAYKCSDSYGILVCQDGEWVSEGACGCSVKVGDPRKPPYAATCKSRGNGSIECSFAAKACKVCTSGEACRSL